MKTIDGTAATETINVFVINDNSTRLASLESGDVDFVCSPLTASDLDWWKEMIIWS